MPRMIKLSNWYIQSGTKYISNISHASKVHKFQHKCIICQKAIVVWFEQVKVIYDIQKDTHKRK